MSSSIDRAFIRAFAKQRGGQATDLQEGAASVGVPAAEPQAPPMPEPEARPTAPAPAEAAAPESTAAPELNAAEQPLARQLQGGAAPTEAAADQAASTLEETLGAIDSLVTAPAVRRVDQPESVAAPLWEQSLVTAGEMAALNLSTLDVTPPAAPTLPDGDLNSPPRPVVRAMSPEQVMRRLDSPAAAAAPHQAEPAAATPPAPAEPKQPEQPEQPEPEEVGSVPPEAFAEMAPQLPPEIAPAPTPQPAAPAAAPVEQNRFEADIAVAPVQPAVSQPETVRPATVEPAQAAEPRPSVPAPAQAEEAAAVAVPQPAAPQPAAPQPGDPGEAEQQSEQDRDPVGVSMQGPFVAAWETDRVEWPRMSQRLVSLDDRFGDAGRQLAAATADGLRTLAVTSTYRGEGRTTVAMNMARCASQAGIRVALVDADVDNPALASAAGIAAAHGWHECLDGGLPLDEAAVASLEDGVTLLPLTSAVRRSAIDAASPAFASMIETLTAHFDLVVIDYGPLGATADGRQRLAGDAALLIRDIRCTSAEQALATVRRVRELGPKSVGVVQNFT